MVQLAWRFVRFQPDSALARWFYARTADGRKKTRKTMIVALARKLLIALWRLSTTVEFLPASCCERPEGRTQSFKNSKPDNLKVNM
jgi:transposase